MNKTVLYIILFCLCFNLKAQENLVYNGDFELYDNCPIASSTPNDLQISFCLGWYPPTAGTSDFFNNCSFISSNPYTNVYVPTNYIGTQAAASGNGYLGFYGFTEWINGKEYIQSKLVESLVVGQTYLVEFYISIADSSEFALNQIGAFFSKEQISRSDFLPFNIEPQIKSSENVFLVNFNEWQKVEGYFIADGDEQYITIGNFQDSSTILTKNVNNNTFSTGIGSSYYYIDKVSVTESTNLKVASNIFTPNNDGKNDLWSSLINNQYKGNKLTIIDRWGNLIYEADAFDFSWDGKTKEGKECSDGTYFYRINNTNKSGFIQLVR